MLRFGPSVCDHQGLQGLLLQERRLIEWNAAAASTFSVQPACGDQVWLSVAPPRAATAYNELDSLMSVSKTNGVCRAVVRKRALDG